MSSASQFHFYVIFSCCIKVVLRSSLLTVSLVEEMPMYGYQSHLLGMKRVYAHRKSAEKATSKQ